VSCWGCNRVTLIGIIVGSIKHYIDTYGHLMKTVNRKAVSRLGEAVGIPGLIEKLPAVLGNSNSNGSKMVAEQGRAGDL